MKINGEADHAPSRLRQGPNDERITQAVQALWSRATEILQRSSGEADHAPSRLFQGAMTYESSALLQRFGAKRRK